MLCSACGHVVCGFQNLIRAGADVDRSLAHAFENLGEVVEHEVHGVHDVAQSVVAHLAADIQIASRHLADGVQQIRDAALKRILRLLIRYRMGHFRGAAIEILRDKSELVTGSDFHARAYVAGHQPFGKRGNLLYRGQHTLAQHIDERDGGENHQRGRRDQRAIRATGERCGIGAYRCVCASVIR